jgi:hypothetical protein
MLRNTAPGTPLAGDGVSGRRDLGGALYRARSHYCRFVLDRSSTLYKVH